MFASKVMEYADCPVVSSGDTVPRGGIYSICEEA